jgi:hypothetical protein
MNAVFLMLAVGFGYWIGNAKSPQVVIDYSKCPTPVVEPINNTCELKRGNENRKVQPVTVEKEIE